MVSVRNKYQEPAVWDFGPNRGPNQGMGIPRLDNQHQFVAHSHHWNCIVGSQQYLDSRQNLDSRRRLDSHLLGSLTHCLNKSTNRG